MKLTKQEKAFAYYYGLGYGRTLEKVATEFKVSIRTAKSWSASGGWKQRIKDLEARALAELTEETEGIIKEANIKLQKDLVNIINLLVERYMNILKDPEAKVYSKDISTITEVILKLSASTTTTTKTDTELNVTNTEEEDMLRNLTLNVNKLIDKANKEVKEDNGVIDE